MSNDNNEQEQEEIFESLLRYLRQSRGFDFTGYKRSTLKRRVSKQMQKRNVKSFSEYLDYLQVHPDEFTALFNTILINVTSFFRDQEAWNYLQQQVIPRLISSKLVGKPLRVWCAGCSSGEEAYTLAIVLAEALGLGRFRQQVKIYATDVDEEALSQARQASYSEQDLQPIPEELRQKYFEPMGELYVFRADIRRMVIFGRHDLVQNAPISRLDILICRNTLMYFNSETQILVLNRFHFALRETGTLFLGKAEMLLSRANLFIPIDLQHRFFKKVPHGNQGERLLKLNQPNEEDEDSTLFTNSLQQLILNTIPLAQIVVDIGGNVVLINKKACSMFNLRFQDSGRPLQDLEISYRPLELRSPIEQAYQERNPIIVRGVARSISQEETQYLDIQFSPLREEDNILGVSITFHDVTPYHELQAELYQSNQELETANEEFHSSNEELETTNEELQSTNEELETTNEELQSTNEELETMNEELQSTNEELETTNDELRLRTREANEAHAYLTSVLTSLKTGVVVVNSEFNVMIWDQDAENFWGLRGEEVEGKSFFSLDIGLPVVELRDVIRNSMTGQDSQEIVLEAINRRGQRFQCRVSCHPLIGPEQERRGVIMLMDEVNT